MLATRGGTTLMAAEGTVVELDRGTPPSTTPLGPSAVLSVRGFAPRVGRDGMLVWELDLGHQSVTRSGTVASIRPATVTLGLNLPLESANGRAGFIDVFESFTVRAVDAGTTIVVGTGQGTPVATSPSRARPDAVYFATIRCVVHRADLSRTNGLTTVALGGCGTFALGTTTTTVMDPIAMDVVAGATDDVLFLLDRSGRVVRLPMNVADGSPVVVAGTGAGADSGDNGPALQASFIEATGLAALDSDTIVVADAGTGRVRRFDVGGSISTVARVGPVRTQTGALALGLASDGEQAGSFFVLEPHGIRHFDGATSALRTLHGLAFTRGSVERRLAQPARVACADGRCVVVDTRAGTLRLVDVSTGTATNILGGDGVPTDVDDVTVAADGTFLAARASPGVIAPFNPDTGVLGTPVAQGAFVAGARVLTTVANDVVFAGDAGVRRTGPGLTGTYQGSAGPVVDLAVVGDFVVAFYDGLPARGWPTNDFSASPLPTPVPSLARRALIVDEAFNSIFIDDDGLALKRGEEIRRLLPAATPQLPFARCIADLDRVGDSVVFVDRCGGALVRVGLRAPRP